jgi:hypothetical protein
MSALTIGAATSDPAATRTLITAASATFLVVIAISVSQRQIKAWWELTEVGCGSLERRPVPVGEVQITVSTTVCTALSRSIAASQLRRERWTMPRAAAQSATCLRSFSCLPDTETDPLLGLHCRNVLGDALCAERELRVA